MVRRLFSLILIFGLFACDGAFESESPVAPEEARLDVVQANEQPMELLFGPYEFVRGKGKPLVETVVLESDDFEHFEAHSFSMCRTVMKTVRGRASAGSVSVDGVEVFGPSTLNQTVGS